MFVKSLASGCCLAFPEFFANFSLALLIKKKRVPFKAHFVRIFPASKASLDIIENVTHLKSEKIEK